MNSQKPAEALYGNFRQTFPEVGTALSPTIGSSGQIALADGVPNDLTDSSEQRGHVRTFSSPSTNDYHMTLLL